MLKNYPNLAELLVDYRLILASGSPRRVKILQEHGIHFDQVIPDIHEDNNTSLPYYDLAVELARKKAEAVGQDLEKNQIALGCDTIVVIDDRILGKPDSRRHAFEMLSELSGNCHTVCSAIALLRGDVHKYVSGHELTRVYFNKIEPKQIQEYNDSGEPMDKAGAYGIQGIGGFLVDRIEGNLDNVIGLPMTLLDKLAGRLM